MPGLAATNMADVWGSDKGPCTVLMAGISLMIWLLVADMPRRLLLSPNAIALHAGQLDYWQIADPVYNIYR